MGSGAGRGMEVVGGDGESGFGLEGWPRAWSPLSLPCLFGA